MLFCYYQNEKYKDGMRLFYKDGNPLNCREDNLINQYGKMKLSSRSVMIEYDDTYIFITDKKQVKDLSLIMRKNYCICYQALVFLGR